MRSSDKNGTDARRTPRVTPARKTNEEIEVTLRVADRRALLARLAELGAVCEGRVHEMNALYDTRDRSIMRRGQLLRIRTERPANRPGTKASGAKQHLEGALLTFKGPVVRQVPARSGGRRYKVREELEVRVADGDQLAVILKALGFRPDFRYEKYRSTYRLPSMDNVILDLDETPIGDFLEAEGTRAAIDRAAELLGYQSADYVTKSYWELFRDEVRKSGHTKSSKRERFPRLMGRDMVFRRGERSSG